MHVPPIAARSSHNRRAGVHLRTSARPERWHSKGMSDPREANRLEPETTIVLNEINGLRQAMRGGIGMPDCDRLNEAQCLEKMKALLRQHGVERGSVLWKASLRDVRRDCAHARQLATKTNS